MREKEEENCMTAMLVADDVAANRHNHQAFCATWNRTLHFTHCAFNIKQRKGIFFLEREHSIP